MPLPGARRAFWFLRNWKMQLDEKAWVDKHGRKRVFAASDATVFRLERREEDPFPAGKRIGGKLYWQIGRILAWVERQGAEPDRGQEIGLPDVAVLGPVQDAGQGAI